MPSEMTLEEEIVFLRRELEQERLEKTYLRSLLNQLDNDPIFQQETVPTDASDATQQESSAQAQPKGQVAHRRPRPDSELMTCQLVLKQTEEKLHQVELQLLHAEETICHLKAEKLEALRRIEHLATSPSAQADDVDATDGVLDETTAQSSEEDETDGQNQVLVEARQKLKDLRCEMVQNEQQWALERQELENKLVELQNQHLFEQDTKQEVIREQEQEIQQLHEEIRELSLRWECQQDELSRQHRSGGLKQDPFDTTKSNNSGSSKISPLDGADEDLDMERTRGPSVVLKKNPSEESIRSQEALSESESPWKEEVIRHPTPHFDLESYEVQYLLQHWTKNLRKIQFLRIWLVQVAQERCDSNANCGLPYDFPLGIELPGLSPEIRDGFLTLVVPLLRRQTHRAIQVHTRDVDGYHSDLRIRVIARD